MLKKVWITPAGQYYTMYRDMLNQHHLLIAGQTGSGKSVIVNALVYTALFKAPTAVQFILIDPKRVELVDFKRLPHTLKYASEPGDMVDALRYAMQCIDERAKESQRRHEKTYSGGDIYIIIDELADLMTTNRKQVQPLLQRIAQVGRSSKVHIIACTQSPLSKVIPTEIKVNFDSIVGLRVRSAQDSRNILGVKCCETLPRYGQCYYMTPKGTTLYNVPMIPDNVMGAMLSYWNNHRHPSIRWISNKK